MPSEAHSRAFPDLDDWQVTAELLARYDRPGPRYTSFPTANQFHDGVGARAYGEHLAAADRDAGAPLSLYVHLPFCEQRCTYCGCNVIIVPDKSRAAPYLGWLLREAEIVAARLPNRRSLTQVHVGGGTPTYYTPAQLSGFLVDLFELFTPAEDAELAVEIDPRVTSDEHLEALAEIGFNRASFGVQDFAPEVQLAVGRVQSRERTAHLIDVARRNGYSGINVDLIYGLPCQRVETFGATVDAVVAMGADRLAIYSFAYVPSMHAHMKRIATHDLPDRGAKLRLFAVARDRLLRAGYEPIGMDHFAKPHDELAVAKRQGRLTRNFQGYSMVPADDVLGLGISAIGDVAGAYVQNTKSLAKYAKAVEAGRLPVERGVVLSADDRLRRHVIRGLMCNFYVDIPAVERTFGITFADTFAPDLELLRAHEREGMVVLRPERIECTAVGELFVRNLSMCFDPYLRADGASGSRFSRTV